MKTKNIYLNLILILLLAACGSKPSASGHDEEAEEHHHHSDTVSLSAPQMDAVGIKLGQMQLREMGNTISASGRLVLNPQDQANITTLMAGSVKQICVREGQQVRRGQVVAYIENTSIIGLQRDYQTAIAEEKFTLQELNRQQSLSNEDATSAAKLQQADYNHQRAVTSLRSLATSLRQIGLNTSEIKAGRLFTSIPITSPISGTVSKIEVATGSYVGLETSMMSIASNQKVQCQLNVFEGSLPLIKLGEQVDMWLTGRQSTRMRGKVSRWGANIDAQSRALNVYVDIDSGLVASATAGMYVSALIATGSHQALSLPTEAIVAADGHQYVFVLVGTRQHKGHSESSFRRVEVITGSTRGAFVEVTPAECTLPNDAQIVISGAFYLGSMTAEHGEHGH